MNTAKKPLCRIHVQGPLREPLPHVISCPYFSIVCDKLYNRDTHLRSAPCSVLPHAFRAHSPLGSQNLKILGHGNPPRDFAARETGYTKQTRVSPTGHTSALSAAPPPSRGIRGARGACTGPGRGFRPVLAPSVKFGIVDYEFSVPRKLTPRSN
jgi:hypothetical protein